MHFSTPIAALMVLLAPSLAVADGPASGAPGASRSGWGSSSSPEVTTTSVAQTTVTMTLLQVQTATVHYYNATTSSYGVPSASINVSATPSVCMNCNASTGDAYMQSANLAVAAAAGVGALILGSL